MKKINLVRRKPRLPRIHIDPRHWAYVRGYLAGTLVTILVATVFAVGLALGAYRSGKLSLTVTPSITTVAFVTTDSEYHRTTAQTAMREAAEHTHTALNTTDIVGRTLMLASLRDGMEYTKKLMQLTLLSHYLHEFQATPKAQPEVRPEVPRLVPPDSGKRL